MQEKRSLAELGEVLAGAERSIDFLVPAFVTRLIDAASPKLRAGVKTWGVAFAYSSVGFDSTAEMFDMRLQQSLQEKGYFIVYDPSITPVAAMVIDQTVGVIFDVEKDGWAPRVVHDPGTVLRMRDSVEGELDRRYPDRKR